MEFGIKKKLNEKVDLKRTREQQVFILLRYTLNQIAKRWDSPAVTEYFKRYPKEKEIFWSKRYDIDKNGWLFINGDIPENKFKKCLEDAYQSVLKASNFKYNDKNVSEHVEGKENENKQGELIWR